jgi:hypothetical protein
MRYGAFYLTHLRLTPYELLPRGNTSLKKKVGVDLMQLESVNALPPVSAKPVVPPATVAVQNRRIGCASEVDSGIHLIPHNDRRPPTADR